MQQENIYVNREVICNFVVNKIRFGWGKIDLLVRTPDEIIIIELKANILKKNKAVNQLKKYLTHFKSSKKKVRGILAMYNCGCPILITKLSAVA